MSMPYPPHEVYEVLYRRYLQPARVSELVDLLGAVAGGTYFDLAGGGGRASRELLSRGAAQVHLVDASAPMTRPIQQEALPGVAVFHSYIDRCLSLVQPSARADGAVCQQAINYWLDARHAALVAAALKPGAILAFNTFWRRPASFPVPKQYEMDDRRYLELSWSQGNSIEHVQVCEGLAVHTTRFNWISPEQYRAWLEPFFEVEERRDGPTSVYRCLRRTAPGA